MMLLIATTVKGYNFILLIPTQYKYSSLCIDSIHLNIAVRFDFLMAPTVTPSYFWVIGQKVLLF